MSGVRKSRNVVVFVVVSLCVIQKIVMALSGLCFAITGALSVGRAEFEELISSNGGAVAKSVTNKCTHLIRSASLLPPPHRAM